MNDKERKEEKGKWKKNIINRQNTYVKKLFVYALARVRQNSSQVNFAVRFFRRRNTLGEDTREVFHTELRCLFAGMPVKYSEEVVVLRVR